RLQGDWSSDVCSSDLTPTRVSRALRELTDGYGVDTADIVAGAVFDQDYDEMVLVKDIPFYSLCEHHMLPFFGSCHVGYLPKGRRSEERRVGKGWRKRW